MAQRITNLPPDDYKTFEELAEYARKRAKISAARNGHQEFAYWLETRLWALDMAECPGIHDQLAELLQSNLRGVETYSASVSRAGQNAGGNLGRMKLDIPRRLATSYAQAVHVRKMLINRGEKPPRLSLKWLRGVAEKL